jgi:hypothetical protein
MTDPVINKRPYRAFLSHAHIDKAVVDQLHRWCSACAGMKVWYDATEFPAGALVPQALARAITDCQAAFIVMSTASIKSGWVEEEWNISIQQQKRFPDFQIIPIRIDMSEPPESLGIRKWIEAVNGELTPAVATQLLEAIHWGESDPGTIGRRQVYLARGSQPYEARIGAFIGKALGAYGLRTVRDAPDQEKFDDSRIKAIISGCGALVAVVSHRGDGKSSKYILREIDLAKAVGVPVLALVDEAVTADLGKWEQLTLVRTPSQEGDISVVLEKALGSFAEEVGEPPRPAHSFLGHSFGGGDAELWKCVQRCIQTVSGMACISGDEILGGDVQIQIMDRIRDASFCLFDITDDRLNSCIEAGVALGAKTPFELICRGPRHSPSPFLFRHRQVFFYDSPTELIGLIRKLSLPFRRVVN